LFFEEIERTANIVKTLLKEKRVKLVSHYDADGLCSASIMIKALTREGCDFDTRILKQLTEEEIGNLDVGEGDLLILTDLGSGQVDNLLPILENTQVLILDHHEPIRKEHMNLFHINPLLFIEEEISGSMVCYLFAKALDMRNTDTIDLAVIGAIGDIMDENWELKGIAKNILDEAEMLGKVTMERGIKMYGRNNRPLYKALEYSSELDIPDITGSESGSVQFLSDIGISIKNKGKLTRLKDLSKDEQKKLASAIIVERMKHGHENPEDIFGEVYTIIGRPDELQNVREFATILNACGRTDNYQIGIRLCLGDLNALKESWNVLKGYRRMIGSGISWVRDGNLEERENIVVIDAGKKISDTVIGTVSSIVLSSKISHPDKIIVGFADSEDGKLKVSARMPNHLNFNLRDILFDAAKTVGGEAGGHPFAAGAFIDSDKKDEFIKVIENKISKITTRNNDEGA